MQQNFYFSHISSEDSSDTPQLPFPESEQLDTSYALQLPFPSQQPTNDGRAPVQAPSPRPLPSTDTIDKEEIRFLQLLPLTVSDEADEHTQVALEAAPSTLETQEAEQSSIQLPFPGQPSGNEASFDTQKSPPQQVLFPNAAAQVYTSSIEAGDQATLAMPMPGLIEVPLVSQTKTMQHYSPSAEPVPSNQQAKRAIINGVIALLVSLFALTTIAGFAGLVIGAFAMIYGLKGLRLAKRLPNKAGRGQAMIAIILGLLACSIVLAAAVLHVPQLR